MKITAAGLGVPPDPAPPFVVNQSRLATFAECSLKYQFEYAENRRSAIRDAVALDIGSLWHKYMELLRERDWQAALAAIDDTAHDLSEKGRKTYEAWLIPAAEVYGRRIEEHGWPYELLATEQKFWMDLALEDGTAVRVLGTFDRILQEQSGTWNGEIKTLDPKTDLSAWVAHRSTHLQDALYYLALAELREGVRGTYYDLALKHPIPKRASGGLSLDERLEQWPNLLFRERRVIVDREKALDTVVAHLSHYLDAPACANHNACMRNGRPWCDYFGVCHEGDDLTGLNYTDREPDYVDQASGV